MATKKTTGAKKSTKKQGSKKVKYVCGVGDDGWGIHDVKDAPKTTQKGSGKK